MKIKKRYIFPVVLIGVFFLGPKASYDPFDGNLKSIDAPLTSLEQRIAEREATVINLKPNNQSRIIWADSIRKTEYSVVYLHGFSASPMEGDPVHRTFAERYGANIYIPRLAGHGIQDDYAFKNLSPKDLVESAKDAIAIGSLLGEKVILMSCSTGSTLALYLAAENPDTFHSLIMYSPNIDLHDPQSELLTIPWGKQLLGAIMGDQRNINASPDSEYAKYWNISYSSNALISLKYLIEQTMTEERLAKIRSLTSWDFIMKMKKLATK